MFRFSTRRTGALVGAFALAVMLAGVTTPAIADEVASDSGSYEVYMPGSAPIDTGTGITPRLVSPGCGTGEKEAKLIRNWTRKTATGGSKPAYLRCGTQATYGLRHINNGRGQDWENIRTKYALGGDWSSFMMNTTATNLVGPSSSVRTANNKDTYTGPLCIRNLSTGKIDRVYDIITPVASDKNNIVTSYPTNGRSSDPRC